MIADFVVNHNLDGVDVDMECFWPEPTKGKTSDDGGRLRGSKWNGRDEGPT